MTEHPMVKKAQEIADRVTETNVKSILAAKDNAPQESELEKRTRLLNEVDKIREGTPIAVLYRGEGHPDDQFTAYGVMHRDTQYGSNVVLENGASLHPYRGPSPQYHTLTIPKDKVDEYVILDKKKAPRKK